MADVTISDNMSLPIPTVGEATGPIWAQQLDICLTLIDAHTHAAGSGVQVTPLGININSDLTFNSTNNAIALRSVRFAPQTVAIPASGSDLGALYEAGVDLYYNDGSGNQIRITQSGSVTGSAGTITGLPSGTASAAFSAGSGTFIFQQSTSTGANIDVASIAIRYPGSYPTPSGNYIQLQAPSSLSSGYSITLPALPVSTGLLTLDSSGVMSASPALYASLTPAGAILMFGGTSAPTGFLMCDGALVSRSTYAALFAVVGIAFGSGDTVTTFALPDLRGRFVRGTDGAAARDPDSASRTAMSGGGNTGNNVGSIQTAALASHTHLVALSTATGVGTRAVQGDNTTSGNQTSGATGGNETRPINAYLNYIIKT